MPQRLAERNNTKMTQIEKQLSNKSEEILEDIRANRNYNSTSTDEDAENIRPIELRKQTS